MNKKNILQIAISIIVGLIVSFGLGLFINGWTRADALALCSLIVTIWQTGLIRYQTLPAVELAERQLKRERKQEEDEQRGSVDFVIERKSDSTKAFQVINNGKVNLHNVTIKCVPFQGQQMPTIVTELQKPIELLAPGDKVFVAYLSFMVGTGSNFTAIATWTDPAGKTQEFKKTISNH